MKKETKFYELIHPGGPKGVLLQKPRRRKQNRRAKPAEMYAVVFFPKITGIGPARLHSYCVRTTLANSPKAAKILFMDKIIKGEKWKTYHDAGHRVRKVKITDLGDS